MSMKDAYERKLQAQLDGWSAEIDKLKAKADKGEADAQLEYYKKIEELRSMHESATNNLPSLRMLATMHGRTSRQALTVRGTHSVKQ